jgi:hypothetical protein
MENNNPRRHISNRFFHNNRIAAILSSLAYCGISSLVSIFVNSDRVTAMRSTVSNIASEELKMSWWYYSFLSFLSRSNIILCSGLVSMFVLLYILKKL